MRMRCSVQQLENGAVRIMCGPDPKTVCEVSGSMRITGRCAITPSLMGKRATSVECARVAELAPGTTWITALIIARQRVKKEDQR
jgi:hypothetical protein